jgi:type IV secretory pathway VirB10-like protein
MATKIEKV